MSDLIRLGDHTTKVGSGQTPSGGYRSYSQTGIPLVRSQNVLMGAFSDEGLVYISQAIDDSMSGSRVLVGDVLLNITGASIGRVCVVPDAICPANVNQHVCIIRCADSLHPEYVASLLASPKFQDLIWESQAGGTRQALTKQMIEDFEIPWAPLEKQRQIAARLKAQLAEVDKARQAAEAQLRDAHTLYNAVLKETFLNGASETWPKIELGEVGDVVAGVTLGRKTNGKATRPIPYLRVANVKDGHFDLSDVSIIEATEAEIERLLLQPGDILLTEGGDPDKLGRGTFWNGELEECIHQNHIFRVRFPSESYLPEFIAAQISSTYGKDYFFAHAKKTTGIATINQKVLKGFPVQSPSIEIQKSVMDALNCRLDEAGMIIQSATKQLNDINLLPQKILAQAFEM